ncbi:allergin-1 isoform X2 [Phodopus roborovskii]|uniref:Unknown_gene_13149 protein n=1 Tax=Phodopus roborovskii TaxID=109678 RepID=A0AAU9YPH1_PHORO|nr:allergin-1 isoform X2 [Phodopus roborovskii]CAH6776317.1 unknown_gene_13149 [Phodopus roborovskii]
MGNSGGYPFNGTRHWLGKLFLGAVFLSTAFQNAAVDCKKMNTNELPSPDLNSSVNSVRMGQNVSLSCSSKNSSMNITYSLFLGKKHLQTKKTRAEAVTFYLKISNTNETGPYKCKTNVSNLQKYSPELNFTISGKAQREESKGSGVAPTQGELYANICETQTEARPPQELHYATPVFKEVAPRGQESCVGNNPDYIYSELEN